jgi:hypothetical protein
MIESPLIREIVARARHRDITLVLEGRFGSVPPDIAIQLRTIIDEQKLDDLNRLTVHCPDLDAFRSYLQAEVSPCSGGQQKQATES